MRAELKSVDSADIGEDPDRPGYLVGLEDWVPDDPGCFGIAIEAEIGSKNKDGADLFQFFVCTARWLSTQPMERGFSWGRPHLFLERWDYSILRTALEEICAQSEGRDWEEVARKLSRYGDWEFQDYQPE